MATAILKLVYIPVTDTKMSGAGETPVMDWRQKNLTEAFQLWKQKVHIYFQINGKSSEKSVNIPIKETRSGTRSG